jgi:pilus assembly protein CpaB
MRGNVVIMLLLAIISGAIAVFLANTWLNNQNQHASVVAPPPAVETSTIVVAATDLGYGVQLQQETLREMPWPKNSVPDGAFAKIADVLAGGRRVVLSPISPNEPVLKWKISGPGARASLSAVVTEGMRAVAVRVNDVVGVGGFVLPGDRVDLLYTRNQNRDEGASTDILIQNVRVLAIDQVADQKKDQPLVVKVVTLEVNSLDAQKIALAQTTGSLSLTLRAAGSLDVAAAQRVVEDELGSSLPAVEALAANPQTPVEVEPAAYEGPSTSTTVGVTRGSTKREVYEVPLEKRATQ